MVIKLRHRFATICNDVVNGLQGLAQSFMERSKLVAYITGALSIVLAVTYLIIVLLLDARGEMVPAPILEVLHW